MVAVRRWSGSPASSVNTAALWFFYRPRRAAPPRRRGARHPGVHRVELPARRLPGLPAAGNGYAGRSRPSVLPHEQPAAARPAAVFIVLVATGVGVLAANAITLVAALPGPVPGQRPGHLRTGGDRSPVATRCGCWSTRARPTARRRRRAQALPVPELPVRRRRHRHHRLADHAAGAGVLPGAVGRRRRRRHRGAGRRRRPAAGPPRRRRSHDPSTRTPVTVLRYEEHLGRLGANFRVELGDTDQRHTSGRCSPARRTSSTPTSSRRCCASSWSPAGHMLLHSACVTLDGVGVMLSALTDTGKTATVLRLLREHGGLFLSDDMTIVDAGRQRPRCFPKPLTISAHTLRAVQARRPDPAGVAPAAVPEPAALQGRPLARAHAQPASTCRSWGSTRSPRSLVPPPKYSVDRLVPCQLGSSTQVEELFVIERGAPRIADLGRDETVDRMLDEHRRRLRLPAVQVLRARRSPSAGAATAQLRERESGRSSPASSSHVRTPGRRLGHVRLGRRDPAAARPHGAGGEPAEQPGAPTRTPGRAGPGPDWHTGSCRMRFGQGLPRSQRRRPAVPR